MSTVEGINGLQLTKQQMEIITEANHEELAKNFADARSYPKQELSVECTVAVEPSAPEQDPKLANLLRAGIPLNGFAYDGPYSYSTSFMANRDYQPRIPTPEENKVFNHKKAKKAMAARSKRINRKK